MPLSVPLPALRVILSASEESRYSKRMRQSVVNTSLREGATAGYNRY